MTSPAQSSGESAWRPGQHEPPTQQRTGARSRILYAATALWVILIAAGGTLVVWYVGQYLLTQGQPMRGTDWLVISWIQAFLLGLPLLLLAWRSRAPSYRAAYRTWGLAAGFLFLLGIPRLLPEARTWAAASGQIVLALLAYFALGALSRRQDTDARERRVASPLVARLSLVLILAAMITAPFYIFGALGSPLDAILHLLAGLSLGLFAGRLIHTFLFHWRPKDGITGSDAPRLAPNGLAASLALTILGGGFGFGGSQILLLIVLPPIGILLARIAWPDERQRAWLPSSLLLGLAAAAPLAFFDSKELLMILGPGDILTWAQRAAGLSLLISLVIGMILGPLRNRSHALRPRPLLSAGTAAAWIGAALLYLFVGQPGFYGDKLFVVMDTQADPSPAYEIADRLERLAYVYETLTAHAEASQANVRASLDRLGIAYTPYYLVNGIEVNGGPLVRLYLSRQPSVADVLDSPHLRPLPQTPSPAAGPQGAPSQPPWNLTSIGANRVWTELGVTGEGIVVGQSDSGVQGTHPALASTYRGAAGQNDYNWLDPWDHTQIPNDVSGHGTHTLGIILGQNDIGVAPGAQWFACVNLARNLANPPYYLDCMQFMLAPYPHDGDPFRDGDPSLAAHVTNNSWGCPPIEGCEAETLRPATRALRAAGIYVVASAGNEGPSCGSVSDPIAIYQAAMTVGAIDQAGDIATFSSRGPVTVDGSERLKPDIAAPGVHVLSALPNSSYGYQSGTSMAGPHVAGVVALMWSAQPELIGDMERTDAILLQAAAPYTGERRGCFGEGNPNNAVGYGIVDAYAAVTAALEME